MKPVLSRGFWEAELNEVEAMARSQRKSQEVDQKALMGYCPSHTSKAKRFSKHFLVPLSRRRTANEFFRKIGVLGNVQRARMALLFDDIAITDRIDQECWMWEVERQIQRFAEGSVEGFSMQFDFSLCL
jgi:hypothetical protein